jgi:hypothetical protein
LRAAVAVETLRAHNSHDLDGANSRLVDDARGTSDSHCPPICVNHLGCTMRTCGLYRMRCRVYGYRHDRPAALPPDDTGQPGLGYSVRPDVLWQTFSGPDPTRRRVYRQNSSRRQPGDLPVEQPIKFDFIINPQATEALGTSVPQLLRARERGDSMIEQTCLLCAGAKIVAAPINLI